MSGKRQAAIGFIFVTLLIDVTGFGLIIPVLPDLIIELTHCTVSKASSIGGWMLFTFALMQFLFSSVMGNLSDRYGRRPVLLASLFGFGLDYLILAFAPNLFWLFVGRFLAGITGASFTTASAYIADVSPPEKRAQNFGMVGVAFGLGFILGPAIGGLLGQLGTRIPFFVAAGLALLNCLYGYFVLPESLKKENRRPFDIKRANPLGALAQLKKYPVVIGLVESLVCIYVAAHAVQSNWPYFTKQVFHWNKATLGLSLTAVGILIAVVQGGLIRIIIPKLGQKRSVYVGLAFYALGFALFAFASQGWMMFVFLIPYCLGGIAGPALQGIISNQVPANEQGELQGGLTSLMSATSIIGPPLMTNLFAWFTRDNTSFYFPGVSFLLGAFLTVLSIFFAMRTLAFYVHSHDVPKKREDAESEVS